MLTVQFLYLHIVTIILGWTQIQGQGYQQYYESINKKTKCLNPPRTARRVENFIKECQEEVRNKLVLEAFQILKQEVNQPVQQPPSNNNADTTNTVQLIETVELTTHIQTEPWKETSATDDHSSQDSDKDDRYIYFTDDNSAQKRMSRLIRRIGRVGDISNGIYHPTLVQSEDKRIAGCLLHCVYAKNNAIDKLGWPTLDGLVDFYSGGVNEHGFFMATLRSVNLCLRAVTKKYQVDRRNLPKKGESCDLAFDVFDCISDQITGYCLDQYKP